MKFKNQRGFSVVEIVLVGVLLVVIGTAVYFVSNRKKEEPANNTATTATEDASNTKDTPAEETKQPETKPLASIGDYKKVDATKELQIYDVIQGRTVTESTTKYMTVQIPAGASVYKQEPTQDNPFRKYMIKTANGKYVHIFDSGGVGGGCEPNTTSYKLIKKLPTATANLFFTQYEAEGKARPLALEDFSRQLTSDTAAKHFALKEGESNTDSCNLFFYQNVFEYVLMSISNSEKSALSSSFYWDDIKDDKEFVAILQSLKVVK